MLFIPMCVCVCMYACVCDNPKHKLRLSTAGERNYHKIIVEILTALTFNSLADLTLFCAAACFQVVVTVVRSVDLMIAEQVKS